VALNEFEAEGSVRIRHKRQHALPCKQRSPDNTGNAVERSRRLAVSCCCSYPLFGVSLRSDLGREVWLTTADYEKVAVARVFKREPLDVS
jgi:hypothetical protein